MSERIYLNELVKELQQGNSKYGDTYEINLIGLNGLELTIHKDYGLNWIFKITIGDKVTISTTNNIEILSYFAWQTTNYLIESNEQR